MRGQDQRSRRIALVPDRLMNAHLLPADSAEHDILTAAFNVLQQMGFGFIQLPPHHLPFERVLTALDFAVDQLQDYARHGYLVIRIDLPHLPDSGVWRDASDAEFARRGVPPIGVVALVLTDIGAADFRSNLQRRVFAVPDAAATISEDHPLPGKATT